MSFSMYGCFTRYGNWEMNIINTCQRFYEKYDRYPTCILVKQITADKLFEEMRLASLDPYSEEHAVYDSNGVLLLPLDVKEDGNYELPDSIKQEDRKFLEAVAQKHNSELEDDDSWMDYETDDDSQADDAGDYDSYTSEEDTGETEETETIIPMEFGLNDDETVSFKTNKFELFFLVEESLPEDYYIVQYGDGPYDGGEDDEESEVEETPLLKQLAA